MRAHAPLFLWPLTVAAASLSAAQHPPTAPAAGDVAHRAGRAGASIAISAAARGLDRVDGELWAVGATYKARFDRGGLMVVPPLGPDAPRSLPLWLSFDSADIGGQRLATADGSAEPDPGELEVRYRHGPALTERYEVRSDGLEQSFVFTELPAERGELVVRLRVATELIPHEDGAGLFFEGAPGRGLRVGALTAIDAAGRRAPGQVRLAGDALELEAPADFVAEAELPLVLDPLIGSIITVYATGVGSDPDVAYDSANDQYLVAFEQQWSEVDIDVYAQRVSGNGALLGNLLLVDPLAETLAFNPTATSAHNGGWVVAWQGGADPSGDWDIAARAISATTGALGSADIVAGTLSSEMNPDIWGPRGYFLFGAAYAVVVWEDDELGIRGARLSLSSPTAFTVGPAFTISSSPNSTKPAIARAGDAAAILFGHASTLVVWQRFFDEAVDDHDVHGRMIEPDGTPLTPETVLLQTIGPDEEDPDVDGDGTNFVVAYERQPGLDSGDDDVRCRRVRFDGTALVPLGGEVVVDGDPGLHEIDPAVAFLGPKYAVAWADQVAGLDYDVHLRLLDPADCTACDAVEVVLGATGGYSAGVELASRRSALLIAGTNEDQAMLVWETTSAFPFGDDVFAQRIEAIGSGGAKVNVGGGCGAAGAIGYSGAAAVGNPSVTVTLTGAGAGASIAFMNVAMGAPPVTCGSCVWEPFSPLVVSRPVVGGAASFVSAIPCDPVLIGAVLRYQWTVGFVPTTCPFAPSIAISDRLDVTYLE